MKGAEATFEPMLIKITRMDPETVAVQVARVCRKLCSRTLVREGGEIRLPGTKPNALGKNALHGFAQNGFWHTVATDDFSRDRHNEGDQVDVHEGIGNL